MTLLVLANKRLEKKRVPERKEQNNRRLAALANNSPRRAEHRYADDYNDDDDGAMMMVGRVVIDQRRSPFSLLLDRGRVRVGVSAGEGVIPGNEHYTARVREGKCDFFVHDRGRIKNATDAARFGGRLDKEPLRKHTASERTDR